MLSPSTELQNIDRPFLTLFLWNISNETSIKWTRNSHKVNENGVRISLNQLVSSFSKITLKPKAPKTWTALVTIFSGEKVAWYLMFGLHSSGVIQRQDFSWTQSSEGNKASQAIASPTPGQQSPCMNIIWTPD